MSKTIETFYTEHGTPQVILNRKLKDFEQNPDIAAEFEAWISSGQYKSEGAVSVEGYTAKQLSEASPLLNGEGAFIMLIELRYNPDKALKQIKKGFKIK